MARSKQKKKTVWRVAGEDLSLEQGALVMGILNVTPDSFSDGGKWSRVETAIQHGVSMVAEGADMIDVGGESSRPGSQAVSLGEELARVIPVIEGLSNKVSVPISVDTCKAEVALQALQAGATIVNDISGLRDAQMIEVCANSDCGVVVMHMKGVPKTMQDTPHYNNVVSEVRDYFQERFETLLSAGIASERLCWDPGIGFGKRLEDNLALLKAIPQLAVQERPVMIGLSRKSFLSPLVGEHELSARSCPTIALTAWSREQGGLIHRVHEVRQNTEAIRMMEAIATSY